jgi:hypothetical protein
MRLSRAALAAVVLGGSVAVGLGVSAGTAAADTFGPIIDAGGPITGLSSLSQVIVDGKNRHVLVSDPSAGQVLALNYDGTTAARVTGLPKADGLLLSPDGATIYVAVPGDLSIRALRTGTLAEITNFRVEGAPSRMTFAGSRLWYSTTNATFGELDLTTGRARLHDMERPFLWHAGASLLIDASPADPDLLAITTGTGISAGPVALYDVSGETAKEVAFRSSVLSEEVSNHRDLEFAADGSRLFLGGEGGVAHLSSSDLSSIGVTPMNNSTDLDVSSTGWLVAGRPSYGNSALALVPRGSTGVTQEMSPPTPDFVAGLAWEPGGDRLAVVSASVLGQDTLWLFESSTAAPLRTQPALALAPNRTVNAYGTTVTVTATLGKTYANRVVEIWSDPAGTDQANRLVTKAAVDSTGKISARVRLTRNTTLSARFAGDARTAPRTVTALLYTKVAVSTKISKHYKTGKIGSRKYYFFRTTKDPRFTVTMTAHKHRWHRLVAERYKNGKWRAFDTATAELNSAGKSNLTMTGSYPAGSRFRVRAAYVNAPHSDNLNYPTMDEWQYLTFRK